MLVLVSLAVVDFLLPAVQVPLFAWLLVVLLWICGKAVNEAKKVPAPKEISVPGAPALDWIKRDDDNPAASTYVTTDSLWAIVASSDDKFWLWGEDEQYVDLSHAQGLGEAFSLAEVIIDATTPKEH